MTNLVMLVGLPGSGKSTWAKSFFDLKYAVVSSDAIRKELAGSLHDAHATEVDPWGIFYYRIEERLMHNVDVVADATFLTRKHRERARSLAKDYRAKLHVVFFKNFQDAHERNGMRKGQDEHVPESVMSGMQDLYWNSLDDVPNEGYDTVTYVERFL